MRRLMLGACLVAAMSAAPAIAQETGISGELERTASTSPEEKISYADAANEEIRGAVAGVARLIEEARREGDVDTLECLTTKLSAIRAMLGVSEMAEATMNSAIEAGEVARADHEFRKIVVARAKTRQLLAEAEQCVSDGTIEPGVVDVDWTAEFSEDGDPTDETVFDDLDYGFDPPSASPFQ